jgi:hypothetical protein
MVNDPFKLQTCVRDAEWQNHYRRFLAPRLGGQTELLPEPNICTHSCRMVYKWTTPTDPYPNLSLNVHLYRTLTMSPVRHVSLFC